jgi:hypothetical protein
MGGQQDKMSMGLMLLDYCITNYTDGQNYLVILAWYLCQETLEIN